MVWKNLYIFIYTWTVKERFKPLLLIAVWQYLKFALIESRWWLELTNYLKNGSAKVVFALQASRCNILNMYN